MARVGRAIDGFRFHLQAQGLAKQTVTNYVAGARLWLRWCAGQEIDPYKATRNDIADWLGALGANNRPSTVRLRLISLHVYYDYLKAAKLVRTNVARGIKTTKQVSRPVEPFSDLELERMFAACKDFRERALLLLLLGGGLRRGEVWQVSRETVDFEAGTITVLGKGAKYRTVKPGRVAMEALRLALAFDDRLFEGWNHHDIIWRMVHNIAMRGGVSTRAFPHRFRHTFATRFLDAGGQVNQLQKILGHADIGMSLHYARAGEERRAVEAQAKYNPADLLFGQTA